MCGLDGKGEDYCYYGGTTKFWQKDNGTLTAKAVNFPVGVSIVLGTLILRKLADRYTPTNALLYIVLV
jgi:hypothetical protein